MVALLQPRPTQARLGALPRPRWPSAQKNGLRFREAAAYFLKLSPRHLRWRFGGGWSAAAAIAATTARVHNDARAFPGFDEAFAEIGAVELQDEIVHVAHKFHESGGVGFKFFQDRPVVHNLTARAVHHTGVFSNGRRESGDARGGHAPSGRAGFARGRCAEVADFGGLGDEDLLAKLNDFGLAHIDFCEADQVAGFLEMIGEGARQNVGDIFEGGFRVGLGVARTAGRGFGLGGFGAGVSVIGLERGHIGAEVGGFLAIPDGFVFGALGDGDARADHVQLVGDAKFHAFLVFC